MTKKISLLDHGHIMLVDHMGSDLSVSRAARVSYAEEWRAGEDEKSDTRLINYLMKNHHSTPFEAVTFTFDIKAPIMVFRQWHRHRTQSYNELSARYRELPNEIYMPDFRAQSKSNKQGSDGHIDEAEAESLRNAFSDVYGQAFFAYKQALAAGVAREIARSVLPVATYSHMQATMNLRNLFGFLTLRCDSHAQYEIRVYADAMLELIREVVPVSVSAWEKCLPKGE